MQVIAKEDIETWTPAEWCLWSFFDHDGKTFRHRLGGYRTKEAAQAAADADRAYWKKDQTFGRLIDLGRVGARKYRVYRSTTVEHHDL